MRPEAAINAAEANEPFAKIETDLRERRERLREDAQTLATLDPGSSEHRELRAHIEQETEAANELESTVVRAQQALMSYQATTRSSRRGMSRVQGGGLAVIGLILAVVARGDTLMYFGLAMLALGGVMYVIA